jgi:molybdopterin converting factor small subunit
MVRIRLASFFQERIGGVSSVEVSADTVSGALLVLTDKYPQLVRLIWAGEKGVANPVIVIFLNNKLVEPGQLETSVKPGDQIEVIMAVAGGSNFCKE